MKPGSAIRTSRRGVGALVLALLLLAGIAFARPAMADTPVTYYGLSFTWSGGELSNSQVSASNGVVTVNAPSGTITISGTSAPEFDQIIVPATNKATIKLDGVTIDEFNSGEARHTTILNGVTNLVVSGTNTIYASDRYSAIWSPVDLTITGEGSNPTLTLYDSTSHANAAISIIARNLTVGTLSAAGPTINGLLLGGTLSGTSTFLTGSLTINSGTIKAENTANYQQALSAGTLTINGGTITATMSGTKSNAISATKLVVTGGKLTASGTGPSSNGINAGSVTVKNGTGETGEGPTIKVTGNQSAIGCPVILNASSTGDDDFYPWLAQGGDSSSIGLDVLSFAGAGNTQTAGTTGISLGGKYVQIEPLALTSLGFTPSSTQPGGAPNNPVENGVKAGQSVNLELSYHFGDSDTSQPTIDTALLTTFFPVVADSISPLGNATTSYDPGKTQGSITFGSAPQGRTTSIQPEPWELLEEVYGEDAKGVVKPLAFPMLYQVTFDLDGGTWGSQSSVGPLVTSATGLISVPEGNLTKSDNEFSYWKDSQGGVVANLATYVFNRDTELTAIWVKEKYDVTFDANGGNWDSAENPQQTLKVDSSTSVYAPATPPTKFGSVFLGWASTQTGASSVLTFPQTVSAKTEYYAQWGAPHLALALENSEIKAGGTVSLEATATTDPSLGSQPTLLPEDVQIATEPACATGQLRVENNTATFEVTAPKENGTVTVTATWEGASAEVGFTVADGIDPVYVTFQGNGGTWNGVPFQTLELDKNVGKLEDTQITELNKVNYTGNTLLAWYKWYETTETTGDVDSDGDGVTPVHGYWHSVDLSKQTFTESTTLTAMWGSENEQFLVLWPLTQTTKPSVPVTYTAAILPEPLQTGVLPPYNYVPSEGNAITPGNLAISFAGNATYGATASTPVAGTPTSVATFTVTAPNATPADSNGVVIQARYPKGATTSGEQLEATATLVVEPDSAAPSPSPTTYTVTLEGNGGLWNGTVPSQKVRIARGNTVRVPAGLSNEGLELLGWYQQDESGAWQEVDLATWRVTSDATLTAQWATPSLAFIPDVQVARPEEIALFNMEIDLTALEPSLEVVRGGMAIDPSTLVVSASSECEIGVPAANGTGAVVAIVAPTAERTITLTATYGELTGTARLIVTDTAPIAVHRLYNAFDGTHLLTADAHEILTLVTLRWKDEGVGFYLFDESAHGRTAVTRLYNPYNGDHIYSTSSSEVAALVPLGWRDEGVKFYGGAPEGNPPIYRLWNSLQTADGGLGSHLWTSDLNEYDTLPTIPPVDAWKQEGVAWHAAYVAEIEHAESGE